MVGEEAWSGGQGGIDAVYFKGQGQTPRLSF